MAWPSSGGTGEVCHPTPRAGSDFAPTSSNYARESAPAYAKFANARAFALASGKTLGEHGERADVEHLPTTTEVPDMRSEGSAALAPMGEVVLPSQRLASSSCELRACYESVRDARLFARDTLRRWGLPELFDNVALVTSELVTNALR